MLLKKLPDKKQNNNRTIFKPQIPNNKDKHFVNSPQMTPISANFGSQNINSKNTRQFTRISRNVTCHINDKLYEVTYTKCD